MTLRSRTTMSMALAVLAACTLSSCSSAPAPSESATAQARGLSDDPVSTQVCVRNGDDESVLTVDFADGAQVVTDPLQIACHYFPFDPGKSFQVLGTDSFGDVTTIVVKVASVAEDPMRVAVTRDNGASGSVDIASGEALDMAGAGGVLVSRDDGVDRLKVTIALSAAAG